MSSNQTDAIIQRYLDRVAAQLHDVSAEERDEILSDLRSHIYEAIGDPDTASEALVRNVLERLGDPADVAREARGRTPGQPQVYRRVTKSPGALEIAAIALTALAWPIGVVLAWISPRWLTRDKIIATVIPVIGFLLLLSLGFTTYMTSDTSSATFSDVPVAAQQSPRADERVIEQKDHGIADRLSDVINTFGRVIVMPLFFLGTIGSPFIAAIYLAIRLQPIEEHFYPDGTRVGNEVPVQGAV